MRSSQTPSAETAVCVIIAARNAQATIATAVVSALREPEVAEVVVVDDASDDRTLAVAEAAACGSRKLRAIRLEPNRGPAAARNAAIAASASPLLCVLDADDYFVEGRMGRLLATPGPWDLVADDIIMVRDASPLGFADLVAGPRHPRPLSLEGFVRGNLGRPRERRRELGFLKPIMRRAFLEGRGLSYDERLRLGEDYALYVEALAAGGRFAVTGPCGYVAVERGDSLSARHCTGDLAAILAFDEAMLARRDVEPDARAALRAHRDVTAMKWQHRRILDRRRSEGYPAALRAFVGCPRAWSYICAETARAKLARFSHPQPSDIAAAPRLLFG